MQHLLLRLKLPKGHTQSKDKERSYPNQPVCWVNSEFTGVRSVRRGLGTDLKAMTLSCFLQLPYRQMLRLAEKKKAVFSCLLPRTLSPNLIKEMAQPLKLTWKIPIRSAAEEPPET